MRKKSIITPVCSGLAILAGSFSFLGTAQAVTLLSEGFEGPSNVFAAPTYNYSALYTTPNLLVPAGGLKYLNGGAGISGSVSTTNYTAGSLSLLTGGITGGQIDGGLVNYNLYAQFSSYRQQNDTGTLSVQFLDAGSSALGSELLLGGEAIVSGLGMGISGYGNPDYTDMRDWAADSLTGIIPAGARFATVKIIEVKSAGGGNIDGYMDNVRVDIFVGPTPASISSVSPADNATGVSPGVAVSVVLQDGTVAVNNSSIQLSFDGSLVTPSIQKAGSLTTIQYDPPGLLLPLSPHTYKIAFGNGGGATPNQTNQFQFAVTDWVDIVLPAPIHFENFDAVSEGSLPAGWTASNVTTPQTPGLDSQDITSDFYLNWAVINSSTATFLQTNNVNYGSLFTVRPDVVVNGSSVTNLISGKCILAVSAGRLDTDIQVQYLYTRDYDLTGHGNIFASFHSIYIQNQDSIGAVEYSINGGATWLPALYLLDGPDVIRDSSGGVDASNTFATVYADVADPVTTLFSGSYGQVIGLAQNQWATAAPNISARVNDNTVESKRVEVVRLPQADNQAAVRFRFAQSGSGSWFFGLDDFGIYSLASTARPIVGAATPPSQIVTAGNALTALTVSPSGAMPMTYQWRRNGVNLADKTNQVFSLPTNLQPGDSGDYTVVVSNPGNSATSSPPAVVTVLDSVLALVSGQWDFNQGDLRATCGSDLGYFDSSVQASTTFGTTTSFGIPDIGGQAANVMKFIPTSGNSGGGGGNPTLDAWGGYRMFHGTAANGGGTNVNQYTLILDVLYPSVSDLAWRALLQASTNATTGGDDSEYYLNRANAIGISSIYQGNVTADVWHRIAVAVDLSGPGTHPAVEKFIDGVKVGEQTGGLSSVDGRFSLNPILALLFAENNGYNSDAFVSSVQFRNGRLSDTAIAAMGGPGAGKIPGAICASVQAGNVVVAWSGTVLKSATSLAGPWNPIVGASKPYVVPGPLADKKFFRSE